MIFVIFSPRTTFWLYVVSTQILCHRKCVNCDKTGFATKQRKLQQNRFCKKTVEKRSHIKIILSIYSTWYARANNSWNQTNFSTSKMSPHVKFLHIQNFSTSKMSPHLEFLHMTRKFSTDNVRGVRDKYQVCFYESQTGFTIRPKWSKECWKPSKWPAAG